MARICVVCVLVVVLLGAVGACKRRSAPAGVRPAELVNTALQVKEAQEDEQARQAADRSVRRYVATEDAKKAFLDQCRSTIAYVEDASRRVDGDLLGQVAAFELGVMDGAGSDVRTLAEMIGALDSRYGDFMAAQEGRTGAYFSQQLGRKALTAGAKHRGGEERENLIELEAQGYQQLLTNCLILSRPAE